MFEHELPNYIESLKAVVKDKEVLISNTYNKDSLAFSIAHIVRLYAKRVFCCDKRYEMKQEPDGWRSIEDGKVILIKGDLETERELVYNKIGFWTAKIDYEINIKE